MLQLAPTADREMSARRVGVMRACRQCAIFAHGVARNAAQMRLTGPGFKVQGTRYPLSPYTLYPIPYTLYLIPYSMYLPLNP